MKRKALRYSLRDVRKHWLSSLSSIERGLFMLYMSGL